MLILAIISFTITAILIGISEFIYGERIQELQDRIVSNTTEGFNIDNTASIKVGTDPWGIGGIDLMYPKIRVYVANGMDDTLSVIDGVNLTKIRPDIKVGNNPYAIEVDNTLHRIYVGNYGNDTLSVIDGVNLTKIRPDIKVGTQPSGIAIDPSNHTVYVSNYGNDTISVIDGVNLTKIRPDIKVGTQPSAIAISRDNKIYVVNQADDTVSVIDANKNHTEIGPPIKVGDNPYSISADYDTNTIYVTNRNDDSVTVIESNADRVVSRVIFHTEPFLGGHIECNDIQRPVPVDNPLFIYQGTKCIANPNPGFGFFSWRVNNVDNSTQTIKYINQPSIIDSILDFLHREVDKPEATFNVATFGDFTASFQPIPPAIPAEYWTTLFSFALTTGLGAWLIPPLVRWARTRVDTKKSNYYYQRIKSLYDDGWLDQNDLKDLDRLKTDITDAHSKGKINELHYNSLKNEISILYEEIFRKRIEGLDLDIDSYQEKLEEIKKSVKDNFSKGKLNELHYNLLNEEILQREKGAKK